MLVSYAAYLGQILEKGGGFAVGIFPVGWVLSRDCHIEHPTSISPCHTLMSHCQQQAICKRDGTQDCAPGMGACSIRICQFPSYFPSRPRYWRHTTDRRITVLQHGYVWRSLIYSVALFPGSQSGSNDIVIAGYAFTPSL